MRRLIRADLKRVFRKRGFFVLMILAIVIILVRPMSDTAAEQVEADLCLIDAVRGLGLAMPEEAIIKGDAQSYSIAAASIVAKVTRDCMLRELDARYPAYGFARNKGYGTAEHIAALKAYGPCPEHRRSFIGHFVQVEP